MTNFVYISLFLGNNLELSNGATIVCLLNTGVNIRQGSRVQPDGANVHTHRQRQPVQSH